METSAEEDFHKSHYLDLAKGKSIEPNNSPLEPIRIENDDVLQIQEAYYVELH